MSGRAANGAFSRKSKTVTSPCCVKTSMNPPPPRLPADGCTTARARPVAIAASTALPPFRSTSQ